MITNETKALEFMACHATKLPDGRFQISSVFDEINQYVIYAEVGEKAITLSDGGLAVSKLGKKISVTPTIQVLISHTAFMNSGRYDYEKGVLTMRVKYGKDLLIRDIQNAEELMRKAIGAVIDIGDMKEFDLLRVDKPVTAKKMKEPPVPKEPQKPRDTKLKISVTDFFMERMIDKDSHEVIYDVTAAFRMPWGDSMNIVCNIGKSDRLYSECIAEFDRIIERNRYTDTQAGTGFTHADIAEFYAKHPDKETHHYMALREGFDIAFRDKMTNHIMVAEFRETLDSYIRSCGLMLTAINSKEFNLEYKS